MLSTVSGFLHLIPRTAQRQVLLLSPFYRWGNRGTEFFKQLVQGPTATERSGSRKDLWLPCLSSKPMRRLAPHRGLISRKKKKRKKKLNCPDLSKDEIYSDPTNTKNKTNLIQIKEGGEWMGYTLKSQKLTLFEINTVCESFWPRRIISVSLPKS